MKNLSYFCLFLTISSSISLPFGNYLNNGDLVSIKAKANNKYICSAPDSLFLIASSDTVSLNTDSCEIFKITINENEGTVSFNSITNYKFFTLNKKNFNLMATKNQIESDGEKFEMILNQDGSFSLKSKLNRKYVCAENNGDSALVANRNFANEWEHFYIQRIIVEYDYDSDAENELKSVEPLITEEEFYNAFIACGYPKPTSNQYYNVIRQAGPSGNVTTKTQLAMFLATILWESDGLRAVREYKCWPTLSYNCHYSTGIGSRGASYFGRGYIQLSWDYNYKSASQDLFGDDRLLKNPDQVASNDEIAWSTAFWYWKTRVSGAKGVKEGKFGAVTNAVNGKLECNQGQFRDKAKRRFELYKKILMAFNIKERPNEAGCYN